MDRDHTRPQSRLRQQQAQHQNQSQQRPAVAARRAQNRQRERFSLGLTKANPAQPESIVGSESAAARLSGVFLHVLLHCCTAVLGRFVGAWWVVGGRVVDGGSLTPRDGRVSSTNEIPHVCFLFHTRSSRTNQLTAPRVPGVLLYVLLHCCSAVCSKGLVGGWVEGALRRPWWVGGPFRTWESFCVLWEMNLFFCF